MRLCSCSLVVGAALAVGCATDRSVAGAGSTPGAGEAPGPAASMGGRAIEADEVLALQQQHARPIRRCSDAHRASAAGAQTTLEVILRLAATGRVELAEVSGAASPALVSCIVADLRSWRFGPGVAEGALVSFPLVLRLPPTVSRQGRVVLTSEIEALQREHQDQLMACLAGAVDRSVAKNEAEVWVTLLVLPSGQVDQAEATGGWDAAFDRCVAQQAQGWRFAPLGGTGLAQVRFPVQFKGPTKRRQ